MRVVTRRQFVRGVGGVALSSNGLGDLNLRSKDRSELSLKLVLAVDTSSSILDFELALQMQGYAKAFRSREVVEAIESCPLPIAVCMVHWAAYNEQRTIVGWHFLKDEETAATFADAIAVAPRVFFRQEYSTSNEDVNYATSIGASLRYCRPLFPSLSMTSERQVLDISGDGSDRGPFNLAYERQETLDAGIVINGLSIEGEKIFSIPPGPEPPVRISCAKYYEDNVIGGEGSFVMPVESLDTFEVAVRDKLVLEIARATPFFRFAA